MEIRAIQVEKAYLAAKPALSPAAQPPAADTGINAARSFVDTLRESETIAGDTMVGKADPHALVMALTQTELAVETAATLRDKVVEAYQEILRMPV